MFMNEQWVIVLVLSLGILAIYIGTMYLYADNRRSYSWFRAWFGYMLEYWTSHDFPNREEYLTALQTWRDMMLTPGSHEKSGVESVKNLLEQAEQNVLELERQAHEQIPLTSGLTAKVEAMRRYVEAVDSALGQLREETQRPITSFATPDEQPQEIRHS